MGSWVSFVKFGPACLQGCGGRATGVSGRAAFLRSARRRLLNVCSCASKAPRVSTMGERVARPLWRGFSAHEVVAASAHARAGGLAVVKARSWYLLGEGGTVE